MSAQLRITWMGILFLGIGLLIIVRLVFFQVVQHSELKAKAAASHRHQVTVPPRRGDILDRNGQPLAITVMYGLVEIIGPQVKNHELAASQLAPLIGMRPEEILARIDPRNPAPVLIKSGLPAAVVANIQGAEISGVTTRSDHSRHYPEGSLASRVIGLVGTEFHGLGGIEHYYDDELAGIAGLLDTELDSAQQEIILGRKIRVPAQDGADIVLTIDRYTQRTAERLLADAVASNKSTGGSIIIMEPSTGGVLASATLPTYDLNDERRFRPETTALFKSSEVADQYEPGSVLKVLTMAAGLEDGVVNPQSTVNDTGLVTLNGVAVRNWNLVGNGIINMTEVLIHSSNIGAQYVASRLGPDRFYDYFTRFGFGKLTGVDLPGEIPGMVRTNRTSDWNKLDLITNSFGQGIAVTSMQVVTAMSAIANDGLRMRPRLVREIRTPNGVQTIPPEPVEQVISPRTAQTLRGMMVHVLEQKALEQWRLPGYHAAGKTGTADYATIAGYKTGKTFASVVALAPAEAPRFAILIRLDAPEAIYGGRVAVPVLAELLPALYTYYRVPPSEAIPGGQ
ncbi:MAG: peptidoglycan D,D-transpeptidase FtsI family protein [Chloroflexota bacterium]